MGIGFASTSFERGAVYITRADRWVSSDAGFAIASDWNAARAGVSFADALRMARVGRI